MTVELTAPSSAEQGAYVNVSVLVTNTLGYHASFITEVFAGDDLIFSADVTILNGQSRTLNTGFIMPAADITILAWVERWAFDHWEYYGADSKLITVEVPAEYYTLDVVVEPPEAGYVTREPVDIEYIAGTRVTLTAKAYSGYRFVSWGGDVSSTSPTVSIIMNSNKVVYASFELVEVLVAGAITRMELEYDETWAPIPVAGNVPQGQRGIVHIWGRNDTPVAQRMGIYWFVADPEGYVAQEYGPYWELWPYTGAGKEHGFLSSRFNLDKVGKYTIWVELLMNPDNPEVVDQYIGELCTVAAAVPEPTFAGFGITEYTKR